jgi:hypothetical protein
MRHNVRRRRVVRKGRADAGGERRVRARARGRTLACMGWNRSWLGLVPLLVLGACEANPNARTPAGPPRKAMPACLRGAFAAELDRHLPPMAPVKPVSLFDAAKLDPRLEPGCILPFRDKPGNEGEVDVGRVIVRLSHRLGKSDAKDTKPRLLGRGTMRLGRTRMHLEAHNDAGDIVLALEVAGRNVHMTFKGAPDFAGDVTLDGDEPLPLPLDALVAAIDRCDADERLGASEDGNVVEARRLGLSLWRARFLDAGGAFAIDTSVLCGESDARLAWRTAAGDTLAMLVLASARSDVTLLIERQNESMTEDYTDPGMGSGIR